jgi:hypothetical protein
MVLGFRSSIPTHKCQERRIKILHCNRESQGPAHGINRRYNRRPTQNEPLRMPERSANQKAIRFRQQTGGKTTRGARFGRQKPSQLSRDMRKLAGSAVSDDFLTTLWKRRLPANMRAIISAADVKDVEKLMEIVDRIHEATAEVNVVSTSRTQQSTSSSSQPTAQTHESHEARFANLKRSMRKLTTWTRNIQRRLRSTSRHKKPTCYYHQTFQARAKKCRAPCTWNQENSSSCP